MYRFVIIENDEDQRNHLRDMVRASPVAPLLQEIEASPLAVDEPASARIERSFSADIIVLDINLGLSHDNGISLVQKMLPHGSTAQVIYVSGYTEYISEAYRTEHVWFLTKPVRQDDLDCALQRAVDNLNAIVSKALILRSKGSLTRVLPARILYIESDRRKVIVVEPDRTTETYAKISDIECMLPPEFVRCHKSFLVNMNYIVELKPGNVVLAGGKSVPVSQRCRKDLQARFLRHAGRVV